MIEQERMLILDMVDEGKLSVSEAVELIELVTTDNEQGADWAQSEIEVNVCLN